MSDAMILCALLASCSAGITGIVLHLIETGCDRTTIALASGFLAVASLMTAATVSIVGSGRMVESQPSSGATAFIGR